MTNFGIDIIGFVTLYVVVLLGLTANLHVFSGRHWGYSFHSSTLINAEVNKFLSFIFLIQCIGIIYFLNVIGALRWPLLYGQNLNGMLLFYILLLIILTLVLSLISFFSISIEKEELLCFILISFGALTALTASNFLVLYSSLELVTIISYVLITLNNGSLSVEAGIKYAFVSIFSSGLLLLGMLVLFLFLGTLSYSPVLVSMSFINFPYETTLFVMLILFSFLIKLGTFPFFGWLIDVYSSVSYLILAFLSMFIKSFYLFVFLQLSLNILYIGEFLRVSLFIVGLLTSIVGILGAVWQSRIKVFIAYSGMSFIGLTLICLSSNFGIFVLQSVILYLLIYVLLVYNLIFIVLSVKRTSYSYNYFEDFNHIFVYNPIVTFSLATCILSLLGLPPFAGFIAKLALFSSLFFNFAVLSALLLLMLGSFSAFYYLRLLRFPLFFNNNILKNVELKYQSKPFRIVSTIDNLCLILLLLFNLFFVLFINDFLVYYV